MWLRLRLVAVFAICAAIPILVGVAAVIFGAQSLLRGAATENLRTSTAAVVGAIEERMALDLASLKAWSALPVMQDALIADDGGDIARVIAGFKTHYSDFAAFSVTDARGIVVASTIKDEKGADLSADEAIRTAATGRVYQSPFGLRAKTPVETIWFSVPVLAAYDRQTVIGTLTGVLDFQALARNVVERSALGAATPAGSRVFVLERRNDNHTILASRADANLAQALGEITDKRAETSEEIGWGEKQYFTSATASRGKGLVRDPGFLGRGIAPREMILETANMLAAILAGAAALAAASALYFAWRWMTPLVRLADTMNRLAHGDTTCPIPRVSPQHAFAEMARAVEVFRQTRIVRDRIAAREQELHRANQEAEEAARAKSEHLASLSREMRTQLTTIVGMSDMINRESLAAATTVPTAANAKYLGYAKDIGRSGVQLLAVIDDLFNLSEAEAGHLKLDEVDIDATALIRESIDLMRDAAQRAKVALICDSTDAPTIVRADAHKLKQVLFNLLSNAVKFTPEHGLVRVGTRVLSGDRPTIVVEDNGIGMHVNLTPVAMIPFSPTEETSNHGRHGAGFGLPLVRQLVELHGGEVAIESEIGKGTTVTVILPANRLVRVNETPARQVA